MNLDRNEGIRFVMYNKQNSQFQFLKWTQWDSAAFVPCKRTSFTNGGSLKRLVEIFVNEELSAYVLSTCRDSDCLV